MFSAVSVTLTSFTQLSTRCFDGREMLSPSAFIIYWNCSGFLEEKTFELLLQGRLDFPPCDGDVIVAVFLVLEKELTDGEGSPFKLEEGEIERTC